MKLTDFRESWTLATCSHKSHKSPGWLAGGSDSKESACNEGDLGSISGSGRSPGGGYGNPLQYSCLENPHGPRGPWWATVCGVTKVGRDWVTKCSTAHQSMWHYNCDVQRRGNSGSGRSACRAGDLGSFRWDSEVAEGMKDEKGRNTKAEEHCRQRTRESQGKLGCLDKGDEVVSSSWAVKRATQKTFTGFNQR